MTLPGRRAALFDLDDTMYQVADLARQVWREAGPELATAGVSVDELLLAYDRSRAGKAWAAALAATSAALDLSLAQMDLVRELAETRVPPRLPSAPGIVDLLTDLRAAGVATAIVTAGGVHRQDAKIDALGLRPLVDVVVVADGALIPGKPDPASFQLALAQLGIAATDAVMVGDRPSRDIAPAVALGMTTGRLVGGHYELDGCVPGTTFRARHHADLWGFVRAVTTGALGTVEYAA